MVDKATVTGIEYKPEQNDAVPQRPEYVPEKFWDTAKNAPNVEAMAKSYSELERKVGQPQQPPKTPELTLNQPAGDVQRGGGDLWSEGNINRWAQESAQNGGQLNAESYAEIAAKSGVPRPFVDLFIQSIQNTVTTNANADIEAVGGPEAWETKRSWATENYTAEEKAAFGQAMQAGGALKKMAIEALNNRYGEAEGVPAENTVRGNFSAAGLKPFESNNEMMKAMSDPRYKIGSSAFSQAYRDEVMARSIMMKPRKN